MNTLMSLLLQEADMDASLVSCAADEINKIFDILCAEEAFNKRCSIGRFSVVLYNSDEKWIEIYSKEYKIYSHIQHFTPMQTMKSIANEEMETHILNNGYYVAYSQKLKSHGVYKDGLLCDTVRVDYDKNIFQRLGKIMD